MLSSRTIKKFLGIQQCSTNEHKVKDLFHMVLNAPDLWQHAYLKIYANPGNMTAGTDGLTIDGYSEERAANLCELLRENRYVPTPVRRVYIPKANGKMRPLGIPNAHDKLVQEVWRTVLEAIYAPVFWDTSHGFRPHRSCHTALQKLRNTWTGVKGFIEFDIEGYFDNIDHQILMELLEKKIDDVKFLNVIRKMLKAGYLEDWKSHHTWSGTPQGGIVSPILANIYLHELDGFVESLMQSYTKGRVRRGNPESQNISYRMSMLNKDIQRETHPKRERNPPKRDALLEQKRTLQARQLDIPSADQHDPRYRRLTYCRYADDFVLGVIGPKEEAEDIARKIEVFLNETLKLTISQAKSGLKHHSEIIRFLGYDRTEINSEKVRKQIIKGQHCKRRAGKAHISLYAPEAKLQSFATKCKYGNWETMEAAHNPCLAHVSDAEITLHYSAEMRGIAQYCALADNFSKALGKLRFLWMQSFLKTLANTYKSSMQKMSTMLNRGSYYAVRVPGKDGEIRAVQLFDLKSVDRDKGYGDAVDNHMLTFQYTLGTELLERMQANECEYCGRQDGDFAVHHVRKLADIQNGKAPWQVLMIARRRKTLVLCISCHVRLHHGTLPDWRLWKRTEKRTTGAKK